MNKLYFGDNLEVMREMDDQRVDLICTDPPLNSGSDYTTNFDIPKIHEICVISDNPRSDK